MKRRDLVQHLTAQDCQLLREGVRHSWWHHTVTGRRVRSHGTLKSTTILRERFVAILGLPSLIGSNTAVKIAPFGRLTPRKRGALYLGRYALTLSDAI